MGSGLQAGEGPLSGAAAAGPQEPRSAFWQLPVFPSHAIRTSTPKVRLVDAAEAAAAIPLTAVATGSRSPYCFPEAFCISASSTLEKPELSGNGLNPGKQRKRNSY